MITFDSARTEVRLPTGQIARVVEVGDDGSFKIDANHRLAGEFADMLTRFC